MGFLHRALFVALSVSAVLLLAGCGSSGSYLTQADRSALDAQITRINQDLNAGDCSQAEDDVVTFQDQVSGLNGVNETLVLMLSQAAGKLSNLTQAQCPTATTTNTATNTATTTSTTVTTPPTPTNTLTTGSTTSTTTTIPTPTGSMTIITTTSNPPSGGAGLSGNLAHRHWGGWWHGSYGQDRNGQGG